MIARTIEQKQLKVSKDLCSETSCKNIATIERRLQITGLDMVTGKRYVYQTSMAVCKNHSSNKHKVTP